MGDEKGFRYQDIKADRNKLKLLIAGAASGVVSRTAISPLYRTTLLFQVQTMKQAGVPDSYKKSIVSAITSMWTKEGWKGPWRGNLTHMIKKVPFSAIKFMFYERYKQLFTPKTEVDAGVFRRFLAGGCAAATAVVLTYPLDLVQTRLTVQTTNIRYTGIANTLSKIYTEEGFLKLYRGLGMSIIAVAPYVAINMTLWENLKKRLPEKWKKSVLMSSLCGGFSGAAASSITFPLDIMRRHIQLNSSKEYKGYVDCFLTIWRNDGIRGFYRGVAPHYLTVVPAVMFSLGTYDFMKLVLDIQ